MTHQLGIPMNATSYAGIPYNLIPVFLFMRRPRLTDINYPLSSFVLVGKNAPVGNEGELWYLSHFFENNGKKNAFWVRMAAEDIQVSGIEAIITSDGIVTPALDGSITFQDSGPITISADPENHALLFNSQAITQIKTDRGNASVDNNIIQLLGGEGIRTSAATNAVTIALKNPTDIQFTTDNGVARPANNVLNILGSANVKTRAEGNTLSIDAQTDAPNCNITVQGNSGSATSVNNTLSITGSQGVTTTGSEQTLDIASDGSLIQAVITDSGNAIPNNNALIFNASGDIHITTSDNTINFSAVAEGLPEILTDSGSVVPNSAGDIVIRGDGSGVRVSGAGNELFIGSDGSLVRKINGDTGFATPSNNAINLVGGTNTTVTASGNTVTVTAMPTTTQPPVPLNFPYVLLRTGNSPVPQINVVKVSFGTVQELSGTNWNSATNTYTASVKGIYVIGLAITPSYSGAQYEILINGSRTEILITPIDTNTQHLLYRFSGFTYQSFVVLERNDTFIFQVNFTQKIPSAIPHPIIDNAQIFLWSELS